ncbi:MAG TPA: hypothetical protein PLQ14_16055 [Actinomycetota bacterium]|nr:hypothetical protein [Ilumatobacter sp.]MCB9381387.1 hypothetical protein [Acidimicrobiaceae bacterium]MCO5330297.1 hypothetical protein [Ilumatobacteraceae bacterium]HPQ85963.1 hypothetical protein [Actinomycetota bacterium]
MARASREDPPLLGLVLSVAAAMPLALSGASLALAAAFGGWPLGWNGLRWNRTEEVVAMAVGVAALIGRAVAVWLFSQCWFLRGTLLSGIGLFTCVVTWSVLP